MVNLSLLCPCLCCKSDHQDSRLDYFFLILMAFFYFDVVILSLKLILCALPTMKNSASVWKHHPGRTRFQKQRRINCGDLLRTNLTLGTWASFETKILIFLVSFYILKAESVSVSLDQKKKKNIHINHVPPFFNSSHLTPKRGPGRRKQNLLLISSWKERKDRKTTTTKRRFCPLV